MGIALMIVGILILLVAIISPLNIIVGGIVGILIIAVGAVVQIKNSKTKQQNS